MNSTQIRNLDLDSAFYGKDASVKKELEKYYPEFDIEMTPGDVVYTRGETVQVSINLRNFKCNRRLVDPQEVRINGAIAEYSNGIVHVEEELTASKLYDVEVTYNGKTSIRSRIIYVIYPIRVKFMATSEVPESGYEWDDSTEFLPVESNIIRASLTCDEGQDEKYLWIAVPIRSHNLVSVRAVGLVGDLKLVDKGIDGEYHFYRSIDTLNSGQWNMLFNVEAAIEYGYNLYMTLDDKLFMTSDNKYYNCIK